MPLNLSKILQTYESMFYGGVDEDERLFQPTDRAVQKKIVQHAETVGVKRIRVQDLRHSHVASFNDKGISPLAIAQRVCHDSINTMMNVYGHLYPNKQKEIADILNGINDGNVLPFRIHYIKTIKDSDKAKDKQVSAIDTEKALLNQSRICEIVSYILGHFDQKTKRNQGDSFAFSVLTNVEVVSMAVNSRTKNRNEIEEKKNKIRIKVFNSIFAVGSIEAAKLYYAEFKRQMEALPEAKKLRIATIFRYGVNEAEKDDFVVDENFEDTDGLDQSSRNFLESAIGDYNRMFPTTYDTSSEKFHNYYKDVSLRMENREIDILIVVNMFLIGLDATTLNTFWVDKNLKYHGLLQAFFRTNRILNSVKTFENIVCFRLGIFQN